MYDFDPNDVAPHERLGLGRVTDHDFYEFIRWSWTGGPDGSLQDRFPRGCPNCVRPRKGANVLRCEEHRCEALTKRGTRCTYSNGYATLQADDGPLCSKHADELRAAQAHREPA